MTVVLGDPGSPLTLNEDGTDGPPSINVILMGLPSSGLERDLVVTLTTIDINAVTGTKLFGASINFLFLHKLSWLSYYFL